MFGINIKIFLEYFFIILFIAVKINVNLRYLMDYIKIPRYHGIIKKFPKIPSS